MNIQEQIKQQEEEFDELGAIFSFPHTAVNARAEIPQRDGFPMIYNGMYVTHDIKLWHRNSIKSILEGLVEREKKVSKDNRLPKKLPNPFYPKEGEPFFKMEGNINFMEGYDLKSNDTISHLQSLIKEL